MNMRTKFPLLSAWITGLLLCCQAFLLSAQPVCSNRCLDFDGLDDYVQMNSPLSGNVPFTIEMWFRSDNTLSGGVCDNNSLADFRWLFSWDNNEFGLGDCNGSLRLVYKPLCPLGTGLCSGLQPIPINDGAWHHVAIAKGAGAGMSIYVDGALFTGLDNSTYDLSGFLRLGRSGTGNVGRTWDGRIDEVRIWNVARTAADIQATYQCLPANTAGLVARYNFNQGTPDANNAGQTNLQNQVTGGAPGFLFNFALNGAASNWTCSGAPDAVPPPVLACGDFTVTVEPNQDGRVVYYDWLSVEGENVSLQCNPAPGSFFPVGETQVSCVATDACGGVAECGFTVTVEKMPFDSAQGSPQTTPEGLFDRVADRMGNVYRLTDVQLPATASNNLICTNSGYFNLYFETGSGMEGTSAAEVARRDVLCQLFSDLSAFITPANPSVRVNIWVRDISQIPGVPNPATSGILGLASSFYVMPYGVSSSVNGIADNEIWKTINSGVDSYTGVVSPLMAVGGSGAGFYHGIVAFNFVNSSVNWHTNLTAGTASGQYDLYTVALHEAVHALGFASLIRPNGQSAFAPTFPYFSRYDLFLQSSAGQNLITNSGPCSLYGYQFNPSVSVGVLQPNPSSCITNQTACPTAIKFAGSVNQRVYTPNCYESGSSLSHLEDVCRSPVPQLNDRYYVMSNATGAGSNFMKRALKPEERQVLCDLGYRVGTAYGNAAQMTNASYPGGICPGLGVAGVNDGITTSGGYAYQTTLSTPITVNNVLANDYQAVSFECLQVIYGGGTVNTTAGTAFTYTPVGTAVTALLRYVPVSASGKRGNITYVYIRVNGPGCQPSPCDLVTNGNFESGTSCGPYNPGNGVVLNCWEALSGTPDLFTRSCTNGTIFNVNVSTFNSSPASNTYDALLTNQRFSGYWGYKNGSTQYSEAGQTQLSAPLQPGQTYRVSFWGKVNNNYAGPSSNIPARVQFASAATYPLATMSYPGTLTALLSDIIVPADNQWHFMQATFTYTGSLPHNNLIVAYPAFNLTQPSIQVYFFIDDLRLEPLATAPSFTAPGPLCAGSPAVPLSGTPPGGIFAGPGVTCSGSACTFNPTTAGVGSHIITYTVTDANGCTKTATGIVQVLQSNLGTPTLTLPGPICDNAPPLALNGTASPAGGVFSGPGVTCSGSICTFNPAAAGVGTHVITYVVTATNGCTASATASVQVTPCAPACPPSNLCLDFDGTDDQVTVPSPLTTSALINNFSVACWIRDDRPAGVADGFLYRIFGWGGDRFELGDQDGLLTFYDNTNSLQFSTVNLRDGQWHHVAVTKDPGNNIRVYFDGALALSLTTATYTNLGASFRLGNWMGGNTFPSRWRGRIDEFKVWSGALTQAQIQEEMLCSADAGNAALLVHFPLDQGVAGGNNSTVTTSQNDGSGADGALQGFALNGSTSNWVDRGRDRLPWCNPAKFDWLEGNVNRNYSGRTKVYDSDIFTAGVEFANNQNLPTFTRRDPNGNIVWRTQINQRGYINDFIRTDDNCFLLVGHSPAFAGDNSSFIARVDASNGVLQWLHTYNFGVREQLNRIIRAGNPASPTCPYTVSGIRNNGGTVDDILLLGLDGQGNICWLRQIGNTGTDDEFRQDLLDLAGNFVLAGNQGDRAVLYRTTNAGANNGAVIYPNGTRIYDIELPASGSGMLVAGSVSGDAFIARTNNAGAPLWARRFPNLSAFRKIVVKPNGEVYAVGQRKSSGAYRNVIVRLLDNPAGPTVQWQKHLERPGESNWTAADLVWYSGDFLFYTDSRVNNPNGFGNEDIAAVLYDFSLTPDMCPVSPDQPVFQPLTLQPVDMPGLNNVLLTPPPRTVSNPWSSLILPRERICVNNCACNFINTGFRRKGTPTTALSISVACGHTAPVTLPCPGQYTPIYFSGKLNCQGDCPFNGITWTIKDPSNMVVASGSISNPSFAIPITLALVQTPGTYTITVIGKCGDQTCECIVRFTVPDCPDPCNCNQPAFCNDVQNGFNVIQLPGCKFSFTPKSLTECDKVEWLITKSGGQFVSSGATTANNTFTYTFSASDQYVVCMTVTRTLPGGGTCVCSRCWILDVDCSRGASEECIALLVDNPSFTEGAQPGFWNEGGGASNWDISAGDPELIVLGNGPADSSAVRLRGGFSFSDILYQDSLDLEVGDLVVLTLGIRPHLGQVPPGTELVVRLSNALQEETYCTGECLEVMRLPVPDVEAWLRVTSLDTIPMPFAGRFLTFHLESPIDGFQSQVDIDNICTQVAVVSTSDRPDAQPVKLTVYPNPTAGFVHVRAESPLPAEGQVRVFDAQGRLLRQERLPKGTVTYSLDLSLLPPGLYFLEAGAEGAAAWRGKIIKQE